MADRKSLSSEDWDTIALWIKEEKERRATSSARKYLEAIWAEVDRQVRMEPIARDFGRGSAKDWYPALELPAQFNTLEVLAADCRRLLFPKDVSWYDVSAHVSDDYMARAMDRQDKFPVIGNTATPVKLDAKTVNTLVRATIDHYHRYYDFSGNFDLWLAEILKYGTSAAQVRRVKWTKFSHEFRGVTASSIEGPAFIPIGIKNTYLDDTVTQVMQEGIVTGPLNIRNYWQSLEDLKRAAKAGGSGKGWMTSKIDNLEPMKGPDEKKDQVELIFVEGDVVVPKSRSSIFLPNVWITIAVGNNGATPVRFETNPQPFRSFVFGHYMRIDVDSPYGVSPLMKGQPVAEAMTEIFCDMMATSRLRALPPIVYDNSNPSVMAMGGPDIAPNAQIGTDNLDGIKTLEIGDLGAVTQTFEVAKKTYEELTGNTDPRRSAEVKSHTTKASADYQANIGLSRTEDFVSSLETGPITSVLYMDYAIIKDVLTKPQPISVDADGIKGWVKVAAADLPDDVLFVVTGSSGLMDIQTRNQAAMQAHVTAVQGVEAGLKIGIPTPTLDLEAMIKDGYNRAGVQDAEQFVKPAQEKPPQPPPPDPAMVKVQQDGQLAQQAQAHDQAMAQTRMQLDQQKQQAEQQLEQQKAQAAADQAMMIEQIKSATAIEVARINAGADVQQNVQQIVADVLNAAHDREVQVQEGAAQIAPDLQKHSQAMTDAVSQMSDHIKGLADMHQQTLATISKPRKRSVKMSRGQDGSMMADVLEQ